MCTPTQGVWQPAGCVSCELVCVCVSLVRVVIICPASTHTALVSSPSLAVLHLSTYLPVCVVGGRASSALISIVKASLRAVFRGGSFVDGCGTAARLVLRRCLRLLRRAGGLRLAAMAKNSSRRTPRAYALARCEAHAPRRGGRMRNDAARDAFRGPEIKLLMPCVT